MIVKIIMLIIMIGREIRRRYLKHWEKNDALH